MRVLKDQIREIEQALKAKSCSGKPDLGAGAGGLTAPVLASLIAPGDGGGPLIDSGARVIVVNTVTLSDGVATLGYGQKTEVRLGVVPDDEQAVCAPAQGRD